jgi:hypothetical protein
MDDEENELDGVELGSYDDFGQLRDVATALGAERFPTLLVHSDCDGEWAPAECAALDRELEELGRALREMPAKSFDPKSWQAETMKTFGLRPASLYDSFFDVDGEPVIEGMQRLARVAQEHALPILFQ